MAEVPSELAGGTIGIDAVHTRHRTLVQCGSFSSLSEPFEAGAAQAQLWPRPFW